MSTSMGCVAQLLIYFVVLQSGVQGRGDAGGHGISHYKPCSEDSFPYKHECFNLGRRSRNEYVTCDKVRIGSQQENDFVKKLMDDAGETSVWIKGREYVSNYGNFEGSSYGSCVKMESNGRWKARYSCRRDQMRPVCVKQRECEDGWFDVECNTQCHCYRQSCSRRLRVCRNGCELGWTGYYCNEELPKPTVEHYCLANKTHYTLMLSMDLKDFYESLVPLNSQGYPISPEKFTESYRKGKHIVEISTTGLTSPFIPNYFEEKVDEQGTTFEWTFRLREQNNVRLPNDVDFRVRCNFSDPDEMYDSVLLNFERKLNPSKITELSSDISISLFLTEPNETKPLKEIILGKPVKLALVQNVANDSESYPDQVYLSPRKCFARSPDNLVAKQLSDANGCPIVHHIFQRFQLDDDYQAVTRHFIAFGLPGYATFEITCSLVFCHTLRDDDCFKKCPYPMNSRRVRSVMEINEPVLMDVSTNVVIRD